jgi:hypothetical protein
MNLYDPFDTQAQEQATSETRDRQQLNAQRWLSDLKWLMSDKRGRRIARTLLDRAGMRHSSFDQNALAMAFKEGMRWQGTWLQSEIETHCADRCIDMLKEGKDD